MHLLSNDHIASHCLFGGIVLSFLCSCLCNVGFVPPLFFPICCASFISIVFQGNKWQQLPFNAGQCVILIGPQTRKQLSFFFDSVVFFGFFFCFFSFIDSVFYWFVCWCLWYSIKVSCIRFCILVFFCNIICLTKTYKAARLSIFYSY